MLLFTILAAAAQLSAPPLPAPFRGTARIFATIGHSEWCPAGNVHLDLATGGYAFTPRASRRICEAEGIERPVSSGTLRRSILAQVRAAYLGVLSEGFEKDPCRDGPDAEIIISNGGTPVVLITTGAFTLAAPQDLTCWNRAAHRLHDALDDAFAGLHGD